MRYAIPSSSLSIIANMPAKFWYVEGRTPSTRRIALQEVQR